MDNKMDINFYRHAAVRDFYIVVKSLLVWQDNGVNYSLVESPYIKEFIDREKVITSIHEDGQELRSYLEELIEASGFNRFREKSLVENPLILLEEIIEIQQPMKNNIEYEVDLNQLIFILNDIFGRKMVSLIELEEFLRMKITTDKGRLNE